MSQGAAIFLHQRQEIVGQHAVTERSKRSSRCRFTSSGLSYKGNRSRPDHYGARMKRHNATEPHDETEYGPEQVDDGILEC
jgi:hypothetical protein